MFGVFYVLVFTHDKGHYLQKIKIKTDFLSISLNRGESGTDEKSCYIQTTISRLYILGSSCLWVAVY